MECELVVVLVNCRWWVLDDDGIGFIVIAVVVAGTV